YNSPARRDFFVPDGVMLSARLNQPLSTKYTREGERFTLNVVEPGQYRGAVIEGVVARSNRSGRVSGRADMTLDFERIRMRDGRTFEFAGTIDNAVRPDSGCGRVDRDVDEEVEYTRTLRTPSRSRFGGSVSGVC